MPTLCRTKRLIKGAFTSSIYKVKLDSIVLFVNYERWRDEHSCCANYASVSLISDTLTLQEQPNNIS